MATNPRPKIVLFLNDLHWRGGTQRTATDLALLLAERYDVTLLTCEPTDRKPAFFDPRINYRCLGVRKRGSKHYQILTFIFRLAFALRRFCRAEASDLVISLWFDMSIAAAFGVAGTRTKAIAWEHIEYGHLESGWAKLRAFAYRMISAVVCLTEADLPAFKRINNGSVVIRNFVPDNGFTPQSQKQLQLLCVGHIVPRKGLDRLLWQLGEAFSQFPEWRLTIVGGGEMGIVNQHHLSYLSSLIVALGLTGRVNFVQASEHIERYFAESSIYVMASLAEGLPMVLLEAKMAALPIVAFDCPTGPREIIRDGIDGYLIPPGTGQFGEALSKLMADVELRQKAGDAGRADTLSRFTASAISVQWHALIEKVLSPH